MDKSMTPPTIPEDVRRMIAERVERAARREAKAEPVCTKCWQPCGEVKVEEATPYEYFGARGVQLETFIVSDCCEADVEEA